jgi:nitroreductase
MPDASPSALELLVTRRSVSAKDMKEPGPTASQLQQILEAAHRVPDHGKLGPWRFIVFQGEAQAQFGEELARIHLKEYPDISSKCLAVEENRLTRAPLVIAVVANIMDHHKIPEWEQQLSAGACCQNLLLAAHAQGYGAQWLTEWYAYHPDVARLLQLAPTERIAGFMFIGSYDSAPSERVRPPLEDRVTYWRG